MRWRRRSVCSVLDHLKGLTALALAGLSLLALSACDDGSAPAATTSTTGSPTPPCGEGVSRAELGFPYRGGPTALFTTVGGDLVVTARRFEHGGTFDPAPGQGVTTVFVGPEDRPPTFDEQRNVVTNSIVELTVWEGQPTSLKLPGGRYWVWSSTGGDLVIASCSEAGVTDPSPVGG